MVDAAKELGDFLAAQATLTALTGSRLYADSDYPPPTYDPTNGGALCWKVRQGAGSPLATVEKTGVFSANFQFRCYGQDRAGADQVYRAVFDVLEGAGGSVLRHAIMNNPGSPLLDPESDWPFVLVFYTVMFSNS